MTVCLLTHGWICYKQGVSIIRRCVLPIDLSVRSTQSVGLDINNQLSCNLNTDNIIDKNLNLKLTENDINVKPQNNLDINIDK